MPHPSTHVVNLDLHPSERWRFLSGSAAAVRELCAMYVRDLGGLEDYKDLLLAYKDGFVDEEFQLELQGVADATGVPLEEVALANLYYDAIKVAIGCTAFVVPYGGLVLHARNLDWWTDRGALRRHTAIFEFRRGGAVAFKTVGWPGFIGCFSGVGAGRFALTLNAVLSDEPAGLAEPVSFLLRKVLEHEPDFESARRVLVHP